MAGLGFLIALEGVMGPPHLVAGSEQWRFEEAEHCPAGAVHEQATAPSLLPPFLDSTLTWAV
jgi:hypothetical protein